MQIWTLNLRKNWNFSRKPGGSGFTSGGVQGSTLPDVHTPYGGFEKVQKYYFSIFPYPPLLKKSLHDIISVWKQAES